MATRMPTMAKLFGAFLVAALGYATADRVALHLPEEIQHGLLRPISAVFGLLVGWRFLGPRTGRGFNSAVGLGLSASVALLFLCMLFFSGNEMIRRAMRMAYGGNPFEALQDMMQIGLEFTQHLAYPDVIAVLLLGGVAAGVMAEMIARRWS